MNEVDAIGLEPDLGSADVIPRVLPILANPTYVLFPSMIAPMIIQGEEELQMIDEVVRGSRQVGFFAVRPVSGESQESGGRSFEQIYRVGTAALVLKMLKIPDGSVRLLIQGIRRIRIKKELSTAPALRAEIEPFQKITTDREQSLPVMKSALGLLKSFVEKSAIPEDLLIAGANLEHPGKLADLIASNLALPLEEQQIILEIADPRSRLLKVSEFLGRELEIAEIGSRIQSQIRSKVDKTQRDFILREQIKALKSELGEGEGATSEVEELKAQIEKLELPDEVRKIADKELERLENIPMASPEYTVASTYLGWIIALPWTERSHGEIDLKQAKQVLDEDHFDLEKIKERILEYLAVIKLKQSIKGPILCLVGPPGTGKTSLGKSVARAMGRKFARLSLGGMRDEAEIRGHRRTYIGALPGRILNAMKSCGTIDPVIMLDEIDKIGTDFRGDPASALLEVLDPEQNFSFTDHYLDVPYDLSKVMFITTANILDTVPPPLLDRMEVIRLSGYTMREKVEIARQYLIPQALQDTGLDDSAVAFTDDGLETLIEAYTREAGLRNLEREINNVLRKVSRQRVDGDLSPVKADTAHIEKVLGPKKFTRDDPKRADTPGVAIGLAWTPTGGDILFIEATSTPGEGHLTLTGQLGDVMKESAQAALTYLKSTGPSVGVPVDNDRNLHIHVPAGAISKDGPSAGVAMMMALASLFLDRPIRSGLAMSGEITLKGTILPVGGIKEKVLAAHRSGVRELILPLENERDLVDIPEEVSKDLSFHFIETADEAIKFGFSMAEKSARARPSRVRPDRKAKQVAAESSRSSSGAKTR